MGKIRLVEKTEKKIDHLQIYQLAKVWSGITSIAIGGREWLLNGQDDLAEFGIPCTCYLVAQ